MRASSLPRRLLPLVATLVCISLPRPAHAGEPVARIETRPEVKIPMRDGIKLAANLFLPRADGKFPVILSRSPYGKGQPAGGQGAALAARGYAFVSQDCRGRGTSGGEWIPFVHERADGEDTRRWILDQPWCDGAIGTVGGSYVGYTQWISAPDAGDSLKALFTIVPLIDPYDDLAYVGGAFSLHTMMGWGSSTGGDAKVRSWTRDAWLRALPLKDWARFPEAPVPVLGDWIAHPHFDAYWERASIRGRAPAIAAPIYVACGWFDIFASSVFRHVEEVRRGSPSAVARAHQHMLMGPWTHGINRDRKVGDIDFGAGSLVDLNAIQAAWFDRWLKGAETGVDAWPALRLFVMGRNEWRDEREWPLARTRFTAFHLRGGGAANTLSGDGRLDPTPPADEPCDRFVYDPDDPVPTAGGCNLFQPMGPRDQAAVERRRDVLVYTGPALERELEVTGPVRVVLHAATDAPATDWTAKLVDVWPDGRAMSLCDGIVRARHRDPSGAPSPIRPGAALRYDIDLGVTSNVFLVGHRVRLEISSSNFPRFDRNPNTGHPFGADAERRPANQTIYHDGARPSHILLPVIPSSAGSPR